MSDVDLSDLGSLLQYMNDVKLKGPYSILVLV